ncbi:hypothetical protein CEN45_18230 [Fischerella thermalis CCMEE 5198]|jgi:hypothetical protein|uniref:hypothetical protein n=1 Tax=Fischerella thermalis TaxID=372787 RepID=UPI000C800D8E|nr:hypothetical protein [Fischerella thermalis]PMB04363.1 hypothetical protein CI594_04775 [Fischerella thermalis CCMEE 5196]PMB19829.1 hypothetical protein CEN45_18230 [Fischerella thermalis CCMEE 5198]
MVRPIERIERDLAALEEAIAAIAKELQTAYTSYLNTLGQAVQQQLILAAYHLCTQGYSENFLKLSLSQRQNLQQSLRKLGKKSAEQLLALINGEEEKLQPQDVESKKLPECNQDDPEIVSAQETTEMESEAQEEQEQPEKPEDTIFSSLPPDTTFPSSANPIELAKWQQFLERATQYTLRRISHEANLLLQKAKILPEKLPEPILEAVGSEASADIVPSPPNLMSLVIEIENGQKSEESGLTQLMAINLRLVEIEFADTKLSSERKQIRNILVQLNKLGLEYQKKLRERSVAQAEAAWRASWYED